MNTRVNYARFYLKTALHRLKKLVELENKAFKNGRIIDNAVHYDINASLVCLQDNVSRDNLPKWVDLHKAFLKAGTLAEAYEVLKPICYGEKGEVLKDFKFDLIK